MIYEAPEIKSSSNIFIDQIPVSFTTRIPGAIVRYTINGEEPTINSPVEKKSLLLERSATVKAKCFLQGKPISETSTVNFEKVIPAASMDITSPSRGLNYSVYEGEWTELPDFNALKPAASGIADSIDINSKKGTDKYGLNISTTSYAGRPPLLFSTSLTKTLSKGLRKYSKSIWLLSFSNGSCFLLNFSNRICSSNNPLDFDI